MATSTAAVVVKVTSAIVVAAMVFGFLFGKKKGEESKKDDETMTQIREVTEEHKVRQLRFCDPSSHGSCVLHECTSMLSFELSPRSLPLPHARLQRPRW